MRKIVKLSLALGILAGSLTVGLTPSGASPTLACRPVCCSRNASGACTVFAGCTAVSGRCVCTPCPS
jgi:hypothetical protein